MKNENLPSNWKRLKYRMSLQLKGFETLYNEGKPVDPSSHVQLQLNDKTYQENYEIFKKRVLTCMGKSFLPIYRMADGEFKFIIDLTELNLFKKLLTKIGIKKYKTCWEENYTFDELKQLGKSYFEQIKRISQNGYLSTHFINFAYDEHPYAKLYNKVIVIFENNGIIYSESNYTSFYYVYALLTGSDKSLLLKNKKILIITSFDENKKINIHNYLLYNEKVTFVDFYKISPSKSMFENIDLSKVNNSYDLVLIGAGIGSSNILCQCEELNTVCIDAGIVLERYANTDLAKSRIFLV